MDGVEHRAGVGLDRDAVVGTERIEIERGHDRGHRRARRLVPADLQPVGAVAHMIGVVDDLRAEEAEAFFEDGEGGEIGGHANALR